MTRRSFAECADEPRAYPGPHGRRPRRPRRPPLSSPRRFGISLKNATVPPTFAAAAQRDADRFGTTAPVRSPPREAPAVEVEVQGLRRRAVVAAEPLDPCGLAPHRRARLLVLRPSSDDDIAAPARRRLRPAAEDTSRRRRRRGEDRASQPRMDVDEWRRRRAQGLSDRGPHLRCRPGHAAPSPFSHASQRRSQPTELGLRPTIGGADSFTRRDRRRMSTVPTRASAAV